MSRAPPFRRCGAQNVARMVKIWKVQEGRKFIPLPRSLITYGPLPFCGDRGRSPRIGGRRGRTVWSGHVSRPTSLGSWTRNCFCATNTWLPKSDLEGSVAGRLRLSDAERMTLGEIGHRLGRKALSEVADTILKWYRRLVAQIRWIVRSSSLG